MSDLKAGAGVSINAQTERAVEEAVRAAAEGLRGARPGLCLATWTVEHDAARTVAALRAALPDVPLQGATTSLGALGAAGVAAGRGGAVGLLLLSSERDARFAVGTAVAGADTRAAGRRAAQAIAARGLPGSPRVLFVAGAPGQEEDLLLGVADVFPGVPAFGGSAADHAIEGGWSVLTDEGARADGVSVAAVYGDVRVGGAMRAPYSPTERTAHVTAAQGRSIAQLDGRPAGSVLGEWVGDAIADQVRDGGNILVQTSLSPLGVARKATRGEFYTLLHPAQAHAGGGAVDVFARVAPGERVCLMRGTQESLVSVLEDLADDALEAGGMRAGDACAAFLIYCAGCAGAVGAGLEDGIARLEKRLGAVPLTGRCTFGEQGHIPGIGNVHTNLSVALVLLG